MILTGEKLPWTVELTEWSAFTLHPGSVSRPLMRGLGVTSTVGATVLYNPPTSDLIHSLALCLHLDLRPPLISLSHSQVQLCPTVRYSSVPQSGTALFGLSHSQVQLCPTVRYSCHQPVSQVQLCPTVRYSSHQPVLQSGTALSHSQVQFSSACSTVRYSSVPQSGTALSCSQVQLSSVISLSHSQVQLCPTVRYSSHQPVPH